MKVIIEAINTPQIWQQAGAVVLRIYALAPFETSDGQWIPAGLPGDPNSPHLPISCIIDDVNNILTIPSFEIDSTVDASTNPFSLYTAELTGALGQRTIFESGFAVNTLEVGDPSTTWGEIRLLKSGYNPQTLGDSLLRQIAAMIQLAVGSLNKASETNLGVVALQDDPVDPSFPIALGPNSPQVARAVGPGTDLLVAAAATTVFSAAVLNTSVIVPVGIDDTITGHLRAFNKVPGVSFDVISDNGADEGAFGWSLYN